MTAKGLMPVAIPHDWKMPEWLDGHTLVTHGNFTGLAAHWDWRAAPPYFLPADHWAAPVLCAGLTPWNPLLQGDGPPKDYAGGRWMTKDGELWPAGEPMDWKWLGNDCDIIGYEATPPVEPAKADLTAVIQAEFLPCPVCGDQPRWRGSATDYRVGIFRLQCIGETHLFQSYGATEAICIAAWNTRITREEELSRKLGEAERALENIIRWDQRREWTATSGQPDTHWETRDGQCAKVARATLTLIREGR